MFVMLTQVLTKMLTQVLTMTPREIKQKLRRNKRLGAWPSSLRQIARAKGVNPSIMTRAVKDARRYPGARRYIESCLRGEVAIPTRKAG